MLRISTTLAVLATAVTLTALPAAAQSATDSKQAISTTGTHTALQNELAAREQVLIQAFDNHNAKLFGDMVTPDAVAISPQGVMKVNNEEQQMQHMRLRTSNISDMHVRQIAPDVAIVYYRSAVTMENRPSATDESGTTKSEGTSGQQASAKNSQAMADHGRTMEHTLWQSTIWKNENGTWKAVYHQITPSMNMGSSDKRWQK